MSKEPQRSKENQDEEEAEDATNYTNSSESTSNVGDCGDSSTSSNYTAHTVAATPININAKRCPVASNNNSNNSAMISPGTEDGDSVEDTGFFGRMWYGIRRRRSPTMQFSGNSRRQNQTQNRKHGHHHHGHGYTGMLTSGCIIPSDIMFSSKRAALYSTMLKLLVKHPYYLARVVSNVKYHECDALLSIVLDSVFAKPTHEQALIAVFTEIISTEVERTTTIDTVMRNDAPSVHMLSSYLKNQTCTDYLRIALGPTIKSIVELGNESLESEPIVVYQDWAQTQSSIRQLPAIVSSVEAIGYTEVQNLSRRRRRRLVQLATECLHDIIGARAHVPEGLVAICSTTHKATQRKFTDVGEPKAYSLVGGIFFLRFVNAALISPSQYGLLSDHPQGKIKTNLKLVARLMQRLSNYSAKDKSEWPEDARAFMAENIKLFRRFLASLTTISSGTAATAAAAPTIAPTAASTSDDAAYGGSPEEASDELLKELQATASLRGLHSLRPSCSSSRSSLSQPIEEEIWKVEALRVSTTSAGPGESTRATSPAGSAYDTASTAITSFQPAAPHSQSLPHQPQIPIPTPSTTQTKKLGASMELSPKCVSALQQHPASPATTVQAAGVAGSPANGTPFSFGGSACGDGAAQIIRQQPANAATISRRARSINSNKNGACEDAKGAGAHMMRRASSYTTATLRRADANGSEDEGLGRAAGRQDGAYSGALVDDGDDDGGLAANGRGSYWAPVARREAEAVGMRPGGRGRQQPATPASPRTDQQRWLTYLTKSRSRTGGKGPAGRQLDGIEEESGSDIVVRLNDLYLLQKYLIMYKDTWAGGEVELWRGTGAQCDGGPGGAPMAECLGALAEPPALVVAANNFRTRIPIV